MPDIGVEGDKARNDQPEQRNQLCTGKNILYPFAALYTFGIGIGEQCNKADGNKLRRADGEICRLPATVYTGLYLYQFIVFAQRGNKIGGKLGESNPNRSNGAGLNYGKKLQP